MIITKEIRQVEYEQEKALREKYAAEEKAHPENYKPHPEIATFISDEERIKIAEGKYVHPGYERGKLYPDEYSEYYQTAKESVEKLSKKELKKIAVENAYMHIFLEKNRERLAPKIDYRYLLNIIGHTFHFSYAELSEKEKRKPFKYLCSKKRDNERRNPDQAK